MPSVTTQRAKRAKRCVAVALKLGAASGLALVLANCASQPQRSSVSKSREVGAFSDPKYGKASPRVVELDQDAPKGGGRYQVGKAYTVAGKRYVPHEKPEGYTASGNASWYGIAFHGRKTANGEIYDRNSVSAAHPTMPLPSYARVTNLRNNHSIIVRVNDRGPYHGGRVMDVSERTASLLNFKHMGTTRVKIDYLGKAALSGSDDTRLVASLRTDGPAQAPGGMAGPVMVASTQPVASARQQPLAFSARPAAPATPFTASEAASSNTISRTEFVPAPGMPMPPKRPFDLETIAGAATPVAPNSLPTSNAAPVPARGMILPPVRPTAFSFGESSGLESRFDKDHPLAKLGELVKAQIR